jgi:hypothetical protein
MKLPIALAAAALASTVVCAQTQPVPPTTQPTTPPSEAPNAATNPPPATPAPDMSAIFDKLDANHDGKLSQDEVANVPTIAMNFARADTDHDGTISKAEFMAAFKPAAQQE